MGNRGAFLKRAKVIISSLMRHQNLSSPFDVFHPLQSKPWAAAFHFGVYKDLTRLTFHVSDANDIPTLLDSRLEYLEIVTVEAFETLTEEDDVFLSSYSHDSTWKSGPIFDLDVLIDRICMNTRLRTLVVDTLRLSAGAHRNSSRNSLTDLKYIELRGPDLADLSRFLSSIGLGATCQYRIACHISDLQLPVQLLDLANLRDCTEVRAVFEVARRTQWITMASTHEAAAEQPAFCDGDEGLQKHHADAPCLQTPATCITAERRGNANVLLRNDAVSRKVCGLDIVRVDALMSVPSHCIKHLTIRELTRTYNGERVWQPDSLDIDFVRSLRSVATVRIEDEWLATMVSSALNSSDLETITIVFRKEWEGDTNHILLRRAVRAAANKSTHRVTVVLTGVKRWRDTVAIGHMHEEAGIDVSDERQEVHGIDAVKMKDQWEGDLQKNAVRLKAARVSQSRIPQKTAPNAAQSNVKIIHAEQLAVGLA
ncbi:unnamed protein product [Peniophora sp. CBMAI 1063]|nr:unnamed protein product [Peniophora sp. CBMAI 1063]